VCKLAFFYFSKNMMFFGKVGAKLVTIPDLNTTFTANNVIRNSAEDVKNSSNFGKM
jgi:hypothetical protein